MVLRGLSSNCLVALAAALISWVTCCWVLFLVGPWMQIPLTRSSSAVAIVSEKISSYQEPCDCDLIPYALTIEHLSTATSSHRDRMTINPDAPRAPRFSFKASSSSYATPAPEAVASHVQVIRRRRQSSSQRNCQNSFHCSMDEGEEDVKVIWDAGWIRAGRRNGLDITMHDQQQLDGLVPMETLFWRARFGIENNNDDEEHYNDTKTIVACPWSQYESFVVGPSAELWEEAEWICAATTPPLANDNVPSDCNFYDTHGTAAAPLFRKEFDLYPTGPKSSPKENYNGTTNVPNSDLPVVASALLFVTGLGHYEAWMNGVHLNQGRYLDPAPSSYDRRIYYNTFDVTDVIVKESKGHRSSRQVLGFVVGNGWFNPLPMKFWGNLNLRDHLTVGSPRVRCILLVEYACDNLKPLILTTTTVNKNGTGWMTAQSGLLRNDLYLGNVVDLDRSKWLEGWTQPGFDSPLIEWQPVAACFPPTSNTQQNGLPPILEPQPIPPVRSRPPHHLEAVSTTIVDKDLVLDMGLNTAAVIHVEIFVPHHWVCHTGGAQRIELLFGELLFPNGTVNGYTSVAGQIKEKGCCGSCAPEVAFQRLSLKTTRTSHYTTQFSWSAFRYIQISSLPPGWEINVTAIPIMTDLKSTSSFQSSNSQLNEIYELCRNTHASNMMGIQSDCPHRERFGYTGDALATLPTSLAFFDGAAFYEKRLYDVQDSIRVNGGVTETAPFVGIASNGFGKGSGPIGWQSFFPMVQPELLRYYGNTRALSDMQNDTRRWMRLVLNHTHEVEHGLGDWMATDKLSPTISGRIFLIEALRTWAFLADSDDEKAAALRQVGEELEAFDNRFVSVDNGDVVVNGSRPTQSGQAMSLYYSLVPTDKRYLVAQGLLRAVKRSQRHITTGMFGVLPLFESLSAIKRSDLAWDIIMQKTYPSYGFMLENNATTLWESWFFSNSTFSHNHPMFSGVASWIGGHIGGIRVSKDAIGADRLIFEPNPPALSGLLFAKSSLETARGMASCHWECQLNGTMTIHIQCPANTRGLVLLPDGSPQLHIRGGIYHYQVSGSSCQSLPSVA